MQERVRAAAALADEGRSDDAIRLLEGIVTEAPDDPMPLYELGSAHDSAGNEAAAVGPYRRALELGLPPETALAARIQLASTLRNLGEFGEAVEILRSVVAEYPAHRAARMFLALALTSDGQGTAAVRELLDLLLTNPGPPEQYARSLRAYTDALVEDGQP